MTNIAKQRRSLRLLGSMASLSALMVVGGCKTLEVENLNGVSVDGLTNNPSPTAINTATQNLLTTWRSTSTGHATDLSKYGYETWQARASEPRTLTNVVISPKTGGYWSYGGVKNATLLLDAVDAATGLTNEEKEGLRGFLKTVLAVIYQDMAQAHRPYGIVLDLAADALEGDPATIADQPAVYTRIFTLLDEAYASLANAGSSFSFRLHTGFAGFSTPSTFRQVNRALYAKYKILNAVTATGHVQSGPGAASTDASWNDALTALGQSFLNSGASGLTLAGLHRGPFHVFPAGETTHGMASTDRFINNRFRIQAQCKLVAGLCDPNVNPASEDPLVIGNRDERAWGPTAKARILRNSDGEPEAFTFSGMSTILKQTDYYEPSQTATIGPQANHPLIRNQELILLRAEANYNLGNTAAAIADLNLIRANRAGLPDISDPYVPIAVLNQPPTLLEELLYEKAWTMWAENATTWLDMKHYGMINLIPHYKSDFRIFEFFPTPDDECRIRGYTTAGCFENGYQGITNGPILGPQ